MEPYESNCLVVDWDIVSDVFGEKYWNCHDGIICIATNQITDEEFSDLFSRHDLSKQSCQKVQFLIAEL